MAKYALELQKRNGPAKPVILTATPTTAVKAKTLKFLTLFGYFVVLGASTNALIRNLRND